MEYLVSFILYLPVIVTVLVVFVLPSKCKRALQDNPRIPARDLLFPVLGCTTSSGNVSLPPFFNSYVQWKV